MVQASRVRFMCLSQLVSLSVRNWLDIPDDWLILSLCVGSWLPKLGSNFRLSNTVCGEKQRTVSDKTGPDRTGPDRTGQSRTEQNGLVGRVE